MKPPQNGYCRLTGAAEVVAGGAGVVVDRVEVVNLVGVDEGRAVEGAGVGCCRVGNPGRVGSPGRIVGKLGSPGSVGSVGRGRSDSPGRVGVGSESGRSIDGNDKGGSPRDGNDKGGSPRDGSESGGRERGGSEKGGSDRGGNGKPGSPGKPGKPGSGFGFGMIGPGPGSVKESWQVPMHKLTSAQNRVGEHLRPKGHGKMKLLQGVPKVAGAAETSPARVAAEARTTVFRCMI